MLLSSESIHTRNLNTGRVGVEAVSLMLLSLESIHPKNPNTSRVKVVVEVWASQINRTGTGQETGVENMIGRDPGPDLGEDRR